MPLSETMVTPSASEMRKNAASEASSFSSVARATSPAPTAMTKPAIRPPAVIGEQAEPGEQEADRRAGQDGMRHGVADRLMRRSIRNTPTGPAPSASASVPTSARRMKSNSANGAMRRS